MSELKVEWGENSRGSGCRVVDLVSLANVELAEKRRPFAEGAPFDYAQGKQGKPFEAQGKVNLLDLRCIQRIE
jgi:hypothetical protein